VKGAHEALPAAPLHVAGTAHVLLVDDEPLLRQFAARVLSEGGYAVYEATDGADALEQVEARAALLDVVVSDIVMPRVNGVELLQALSLSHPELPVVLMSGYGVAQLCERGIPPPCVILAKPFLAEHLLDEVRRCLRDRS
jgi:two-component system cell cycle sensor histidine kinase/response regulator CckA